MRDARQEVTRRLVSPDVSVHALPSCAASVVTTAQLGSANETAAQAAATAKTTIFFIFCSLLEFFFLAFIIASFADVTEPGE